MMRKFYIFIFLFIAAFALQAQNRAIPNGYYDNAAGKTGDQLKAALHDIIDNHTTITYANVWGAFQSTDLKSNGKIWDMYSDIPNGTPPYEYTYGQNQCGNYDSEGDCYNREHSWPKSWFTGDENSVPGRDLHHIFPTDGYVNQQRSDNPFGEVQTVSKTFQNGSKLGTCKSSLGYSGTVYEPIDAYKGDFARAYFYMSVRYYGEDSNWSSSDMTTKSELKPWALAMLLRWNEEDPVSAKEIARNEAVYGIQNNRNPFIDHPEYANMIWGDVFEGTFSQYTADIVEGDYIIVYSGHALTNTISSNKLTSTDVTPQNGVITNPSRTIVWHISKVSNTNYWTIKNEAVNKYAAGKSDKNQMELLSDVTNYAKWTPTRSNDVFEFENYGRSQLSQYSDNKLLRCNTSSNNAWAPYSTSTGGAVTLYKYMPLEYAYSINGVMGSTTPVSPGTSITLADGANISADYTFAGWTDNLNDIGHNIHTAGSSYTINGNVVLYAVYAHEVSGTPVTTYNKVTSAPSNWSGEYLIVCENNSVVFDGALTTLDAGNNVITNVSISNGVINPTNALNAATFTIAKVGNTSYYSIKNQNNKYIGWSNSGDNGLTTSTTALSNAISLQNSGSRIAIQGTNNGSAISKYLRFNSTTGNTAFRFRYYSDSNGTQNIQLYKKTTTTPTITTYYIQVRELPEGNTEIENITTADIITVPSGSVLTITGTSNTGTTENLIIENGGQLIVPNNTTVAATVKKTTLASTAKGTNQWYIISSPVNNAAVADVARGVYNMYYYNEPDNMWMNDKVGENPSNITVQFDHLTNGRGYLYRSSENNIEFAGDVNSGNANGEVTVALSFANNTNTNLKGFNLIGNPFTHNIYKNDVVQAGNNLPAINSDKLSAGFYKLTPDGAWDAKYGKDNPIKPGEAVLVKATSSGNLTITNTINNAATYTPTTKSGYDNIMFTVENNRYSDVAYAMFNEGEGLNKIDHYNNDIQMLYISQDDANYAIAMMDDDTKVISLGFKAKTMGQYSLRLKSDGNFNYLHLIDRFTGEDVDMLLDDIYTFVGSPSDKENRFIVRLEYAVGNNEPDDSSFAYQNGSDVIVTGNGELQIFDLMGRLIAKQYVSGFSTWSVASMPTGLYIMKLNEKTQKIVVK